MAKVSMGLVPNQETGDIAQKFTSYIQTLAPDNVRVTVKDLHGGNPAITPLDAPSVHAAVRALRRAFNGTEPYFIREGGSIPIVLLFDTILQAPTVLMGFGLHSENTHSPDEHFHLHNYHLGALSCAYFVEELAVK
jgi:acetylornithine deacetylase/succinyl-diaminopimelate desuccinylase-like protein